MSALRHKLNIDFGISMMHMSRCGVIERELVANARALQVEHKLGANVGAAASVEHRNEDGHERCKSNMDWVQMSAWQHRSALQVEQELLADAIAASRTPWALTMISGMSSFIG